MQVYRKAIDPWTWARPPKPPRRYRWPDYPPAVTRSGARVRKGRLVGKYARDRWHDLCRGRCTVHVLQDIRMQRRG